MRVFKPFSLNLRGRLVEFERPAVMGILNVTEDSFYAESRAVDAEEIAERGTAMIAAGADILDVGGCSTRPGSKPIGTETELARTVAAVEALRGRLPEAVISVDTFRTEVARAAIAAGADIVNDVSGLAEGDEMIAALVEMGVPYILTDAGLPAETEGEETAAAVCLNLQRKLRRLTLAGVNDVIVDPGFGFGKTSAQNFALLRDLELLETTDCPILVGVSRKSMITKTLGTTAEEALAGTIALNMAALERGASIIRVHDAREGIETVKMYNAIATRGKQ